MTTCQIAGPAGAEAKNQRYDVARLDLDPLSKTFAILTERGVEEQIATHSRRKTDSGCYVKAPSGLS